MKYPVPPREADGQGRPVVARCPNANCGANYIEIPKARRCELCQTEVKEVY